MTVSTAVRRQYLDAMGVQVWEERGTVQTVEELAPTLDVAALGNLEHSELFAAVESCQACALSNNGAPKLTPIARGQSTWFVVGDVPSPQDNSPLSLFSSSGSQLFNDILLSVGEKFQTTYLTTSIKCAQTSTKPTDSDYACCQPFFTREIELVKPAVVLLLGETAAKSVLASSKGIDELRGKVHVLDSINAPCVVTYHPHQLLKTASLKKAVWDDIRLAKAQV